MHVCVLGAGIVGLAAAYQLSRAGHQVTVIDRAGVAAGASGGNGAQLSYSYVQPLADPSIWLQLPKLLLSPSSPLKIRPRLDTRQWTWGMRFLLACNAARSRATTAQLLALAADSRIAFDAFRERESVECDFSATGKLVLYRSDAGFAAARGQMGLQQELGGAAQQALGPSETVAVEPALAAVQHEIAGAIYTPSECAADCQKVCEQLTRILTARGVRLVLGQAVDGFVQQGQRLVAARTSGGELPADAFVLALGAASAALAAPLGIALPIYPLKGYSITVPVVDPALAPRVNITDAARKVVFARIGDRLRVAGMAELVGDDRSIPQGRIDTLAAATASLFPGSFEATDLQPWTGMRPATPTGAPIVGIHPDGPHNLVLDTGHGALGFTLAFGSAQRVTQALAAR